MTTINTNQGAALGRAGIVARFTSLLEARRDTRVTRRELSRLTDRELDDIGLCRGDIERIARGF